MKLEDCGSNESQVIEHKLLFMLKVTVILIFWPKNIRILNIKGTNFKLKKAHNSNKIFDGVIYSCLQTWVIMVNKYRKFQSNIWKV